jgi:hypothetical protein
MSKIHVYFLNDNMLIQFAKNVLNVAIGVMFQGSSTLIWRPSPHPLGENCALKATKL